MNACTNDLTEVLPAALLDMDMLAIEIGGTNVRLARFDGKARRIGEIVRLATPNYLTHPTDDADDLMAQLFVDLRAAAASLFFSASPASVVLAYPGPVVGDGLVRRSPTILGPGKDRSHDIGAAVRELWPRARVHVINDLTAAGYYFVGRGQRDFCVIGVGSGIGNKVFLDGKPQLGNAGYGGEIGHLKTSPQPGTSCAHLQDELGNLASGRGVLWLSRLMNSAADGDSEQFVAAFRAGDTHARETVRAAAHPLALAISTLHLGIGLTRFFIVGGFAKALGPDYRDMLVAWCRELTWDVGQDWSAMIELGTDDAEEGLAGGAWFASQQRSLLGAQA